MNIKDVIHILDEFNDYGRKKHYSVDSQVSSNKDFYVYMTTNSGCEVEIGFHQYGDNSTRVNIDVSKGVVSISWSAMDTAIKAIIDFEYVVSTMWLLVQNVNKLPCGLVTPPKREVEVEDKDWWE